MKRYIITGATGYIGSMLVERLLKEDKDVTVVVRNPERLKSSIRNKVKVIQADIVNLEATCKITDLYDCLIHCAAYTQSSYMISNPVEVAESIVNGTQNMLKLAVRCHVKSMVYLSSMEVYGKVDCPSDSRIGEDELGDLDISNIRSCYPMAKRMAENLCHLYHSEYGVPVKIARLAQTFGRGVRPGDKRVFVQFAESVRNNTDIVLHTKGNSVGNYCDIDDVIDAILFLSKYGESAQAYNIVNEANTMTIREMAELVSKKISGGKIKVTYDIPYDNRFGYAAETGLRLSGAKMKELGWESKTDLEEMYRRMLTDK
jgi:UDP-glucuronate decarboxylase